MNELRVEPVTPAVGAQVSGVDLGKPLAPEIRAALESALLEHGVLFFRDQDISVDEQVAFARQLGEISIPPFAPKYGDDPEVVVLDQVSPKGEGADEWHSDNTFMAEPPMGSILKAVQLPRQGGDTCFAHMGAAYDALSEPLRRLVEGLSAVHDITKPLAKAIAAGHSEANLAEVQAKWPPVVHPVVRTHPVTGRKVLFVNGNSTTRLVGLSDRENEALLRLLIDHVRDPTFQCRFRWDTHSVAFWDNRLVQHYAVPDYTERRVMHRVTLVGDRPR
ncbi:MAG: TauD/TfdA family dioxygenase [Proteobacteria bacterium]|nr:TauD/TfdA family dioxygenase [Pseudomonadota bacterium]